MVPEQREEGGPGRSFPGLPQLNFAGIPLLHLSEQLS